MSRRLPATTRPRNLAVVLRETFIALNDLALARIAERGHAEVRAAHGVVFQYLDDEGTTVSTLAERAQVTKQAMAELVLHLERHGYLTRVPDPGDRRAKLVLPTDQGREVIAIAQELVPEIEGRLRQTMGADRMSVLRDDLEAIRRVATEESTTSR